MRHVIRDALAAGCLLLGVTVAPALAQTSNGANPTPGAEQPPEAIENAPAEIIETDPAPLDTAPPENAQNTLGGGRLAAGQFNSEDLVGLTVVSADGKDVGEVAGFIIDADAGRIDELVVASDSFLGLSYTQFGVDWSHVRLDKESDEVALTISQEEMAQGFKDKDGGQVKD